MTAELRQIKTTKVPLHYQAQLYLRNLIKEGAYQPGQKLPPEGIFAQKMGISRPTLREALHNLEVEGLIVRKHGVGTFVSPSDRKMLESGLEVLESIQHIAERMGLKTKMGHADVEERQPTSEEQASLECSPETQVLSVARIILVGTRPVAHLWDLVPTQYLQRSDLGNEFEGSILDILIEQARVQLAYSFTRLKSVAADAKLAPQLGIARRTPLMKLEARLYTRDNRVADFSVSNFVPDFFDFHVIRKIGS